MAQLAAKQGVTVTDAADRRGDHRGATTPETRHVWVIGVKPEPSPRTRPSPRTSRRPTAKAKADQALADLKAGKALDEVAKTMARRPYASQAGDVGWVTKGNSQSTTPVDGGPVHAAASTASRDVIGATDGMFRIGRVTEIAPAAVDAAYQQKIVKDQGITSRPTARRSEATALRRRSSDKLVADAVNQPTPQRHVSEIYLAATSAAEQGPATRSRSATSSTRPTTTRRRRSPCPTTDPAWKKAEDEAERRVRRARSRTRASSKLDGQDQSDDTGTKARGRRAAVLHTTGQPRQGVRRRDLRRRASRRTRSSRRSSPRSAGTSSSSSTGASDPSERMADIKARPTRGR